MTDTNTVCESAWNNKVREFTRAYLAQKQIGAKQKKTTQWQCKTSWKARFLLHVDSVDISFSPALCGYQHAVLVANLKKCSVWTAFELEKTSERTEL